jgi:hypothetical protein
MKTVLIAAAALLAMPAAAQAASDTNSSGGTTAVAASSAAAPAVAADTKRYCMFEDVTSSRLARKVCKSRAEWLAQGVEITRTR